MKIVADLHLHSKYSRAVSPQMVIPEMAKWAKKKGIDVLGTGDFTHPLWFLELRNFLEEKDGILELKEKKNQGERKDKKVKFLLTTEISSIYSQGGRTRKIHNLIIAPSFATADKINAELKTRGCNLASDGRPIVRLSAKDVLSLVLSVDENCLVIPCHIWTPHFSLFGSESGFDDLTECFGNLSKYIYAVETGLSSDPQMNWSVPQLDNINIVSFSDAHSGAKLGRECTVFKIDTKILRYEDIKRAIMDEGEKWEVGREVRVGGGQTKNSSSLPIPDPPLISHPQISHTIEFYPEEGKYHWTGHRNCGVIYSPEQTKKRGVSCPVCGRRLTVGVMERVRKLGGMGDQDMKEEETIDTFGVKWIKQKGKANKRPPFIKLVPLKEIVSEVLDTGENSQKTEELYDKLVRGLGNEIGILTKRGLKEMGEIGGEKLAEGVGKVRKGDIFIKPGYDGEYGVVKIWGGGEKCEMRNAGKEQMSLFG